MTGHAILQIVKGVQKVPGDTLSAEVGLDSIDLLDTNGFSTDMYEMKIPALKSSAVYADSPLSDGRTLIAGALGNVNETLRVTLTAGTIVQLSAMLSKLLRFKQDCNDFWDTFGQIEPVYIKHQVSGEPGPRYALLYDIDIAVESPINPSEPTRDLTIVIEREYGWRGIAPGDNPKRWAIENVFSNQTFNSTNASLMNGVDFLVNESNILNYAVQNTGQTGYTIKNFVDIPAAKISGDLPALLCLNYVGSLGVGGAVNTSLFVSKSTKRNTGNVSRRTGTNQYIIHVLNAADATVLTDTTLAADTGASTGISGLQRRSNTTFATATLISRLGWSSNNYTGNGFDLSVLRGRYAVFCRARLSAAATTVNLQLKITESNSVNPVALDPIVFTNEGSGGTGNTTSWGVAYLGQITLPVSDRKTVVSSNGMGIAVDLVVSQTPIALELYAGRTAGAGVLYVNDVILMPIDEGAINIISSNTAIALPSGGGVVYDNTGYLRHGIPGDYVNLIAMAGSGTPNREIDILQLSGSSIYLTPGIDNRLEFFAYSSATMVSQVVQNNHMTIKASIVPRWSGLRDA